MKYKLLAVDVDGTLLRRDGSIHEHDRGAIGRLRAKGVPVTIATGRLYSGCSAIARRIGIGGPIACVDGSHIVNLEGDEPLYQQFIVGEDASVVRSVVDSHELASFLFAQDSIVHDERGSAFTPYVETWSTNIDCVDRVTSHPYWDHEHGVMAVVSIGSKETILAVAAELHARLPASVKAITFPLSRLEGGFAMVARARGPTKGTAIRWLAEHYACSTEEVVVVGDWLNDVPMFEAAGRSFVMGQAPDAVKAAATDELEADARTGGGIAEAIRKAWDI